MPLKETVTTEWILISDNNSPLTTYVMKLKNGWMVAVMQNTDYNSSSEEMNIKSRRQENVKKHPFLSGIPESYPSISLSYISDPNHEENLI